MRKCGMACCGKRAAVVFLMRFPAKGRLSGHPDSDERPLCLSCAERFCASQERVDLITCERELFWYRCLKSYRRTRKRLHGWLKWGPFGYHRIAYWRKRRQLRAWKRGLVKSGRWIPENDAEMGELMTKEWEAGI